MNNNTQTNMTAKIKATLTLLGIFGIVVLVFYSPTLVLGGFCLIMTYMLWKGLCNFFEQREINK